MSIAVLKAAAEFGWSDTVSGVIQSSFLWGYMATQLAGGILADKLGGKVVMAFSVAWFSVATALTPLAAGLGQGVRPERRATALGVSFAGFHSGNILGLLVS